MVLVVEGRLQISAGGTMVVRSHPEGVARRDLHVLVRSAKLGHVNPKTPKTTKIFFVASMGPSLVYGI